MGLVLHRFLAFALASGILIFSSSTYSVQVRLLDGKHSYEGRVEVRVGEQWKSVSESGWGLNESRVVCSILGFPGVERYVTRLTLRYVTWLHVLSCTGEERNITQCVKQPDERGYLVAGVVCLSHKNDVMLKPKPSRASAGESDLRMRLLGPVRDGYISEGKVQVEREGRWGFICPTRWSYSEARVVCGQLGFPDAQRRVSFREVIKDVNVTYWMDGVRCAGTESSLVSCDHRGWDPHSCSKKRVVRVTCVRFTLTKAPRIRLRSGAQIHEGRVEVKRTSYWGTICDDNWDLLDASVACRSLGYGSAAMALHRAHYGQGVGKIAMDDVTCTGRESDLLRCRQVRRRNEECKTHYEDAGVQCHAPELQGHKIRLNGGTNSMEGRVEVFHEGVWGTVCADTWHIEEAMVVCRQLGLGFAERALTGNSFEINDVPSPHVLMSGVDCRHDKISLYQCEHHGWEHVNCSSTGNTAGVLCVKELPDLVLDVKNLQETMELEFIPMPFLRCALEENCLGKSAKKILKTREHYTRRLLRFSLTAENRGLADFRPHMSQEDWIWHKCHNHYHSMEAFTHYDLNYKNGNKAAEGHKASFCLEDTKCDAGIDRRWNCTNGGAQGISPNCYDVYRWDIDCQWIDITDLYMYGSYYIRVHVNPGNLVAESNFKNNIAKCEVYDYYGYSRTMRCKIEDCESGVDTHSGTAYGACCQFPFLFEGKLYNSCIKGRANFLWCGTTFDVKKDRKWGKCYV